LTDEAHQRLVSSRPQFQGICWLFGYLASATVNITFLSFDVLTNSLIFEESEIINIL
jgi:hypothetical protein